MDKPVLKHEKKQTEKQGKTGALLCAAMPGVVAQASAPLHPHVGFFQCQLCKTMNSQIHRSVIHVLFEIN